MIGIIRSELVRLTRLRLVLAWFGLMALFAVMVNTVMFTTAVENSGPMPDAPGATFPDLATLTSSQGLIAGVAAASSLFGVVTLSFWAMSQAGDFSSGLIRLLVAAQPSRWRLVVAKVISLSLMTAAASLVAVVVNVAAALPSARSAGVDTSAWSIGLLGNLASGWFNAWVAMCVWGVFGLALAMITRSSAAAIAIGVGYVLVVESIIKMTLDRSDWLLGSTLTALASGGDAGLTYLQAGLWGCVYVVAALVVALAVFQRRDISD